MPDTVSIPAPSNVYPVNIEDIMHTAYLQYSLSVNVGRAIPDVRDGLKPGNRRILFAMRQLGLSYNRSYTKCAKVVGEVIGNYHPHGDQAVYDTMVRMAQDFAQRYMLVDGQGNFGSIDGDSAAAYRYTECRLQRLAEELLTDLDKETVDMQATFDEKTLEPTVLPSRFPNLLVNGGTGIGVGMATNIPPHNLTEVINATVHLIENPHTPPLQLMEFIKGPDFPTGAMIMGAGPIRELYETGHGVIKIRAKADIITKDNGRERIIVTEIPYAVNKESLITKIADLVHAKVIPGISSLNDESSSRVGIRVVIDVKSNEMASVVLNQLYKHSQLQTSFGAQFLVVDRNRPRTMNLSQLLQAYIDHRFEVITRRCIFELKKAEARAHILEGLLKAVDNIDEVVAIIRGSRTRDEANTGIITRFELSKLQARAILEMRLHQLVGLAMEDLQTEYDEVMTTIDRLKDLLAHREKLMAVVREELIEVRDKFGDERRTVILGSADDIGYEDLIKREIVAITVTNTGYIKRTSLEEFRTQKRGGLGVKGMQTKDQDYVRQLFTASTHDYILFFTDAGKMHYLKVWQIPEGGRHAKGKAIVNLVDIEKDENVRAMVTVAEVDCEDQFLVFATRQGVVKKTCLNAFKHLRKVAIRAINIDEDDDLIDVKLCEEGQEIMLFSNKGRVCRFTESEARSLGRATRGVTGIRLHDDGTDGVVAVEVVSPNIDILTISENGMGKRSNIGTGHAEIDRGNGYRLTKRGGKGITAMKLRDEDRIVASLHVEEGDELLVTTTKGLLIRMSADDFRVIGRNTYGVKALNLKKNDAVSSVSCIQVLEGEDEDGDDPEGGDDAETTEVAESATEESASTEAPVESAESADEPEAEGE
jgi:DNA gyrase subunit A